MKRALLVTNFILFYAIGWSVASIVTPQLRHLHRQLSPNPSTTMVKVCTLSNTYLCID